MDTTVSQPSPARGAGAAGRPTTRTPTPTWWCWTTSTSPCAKARWWRCSAAPAPASPPCCASSPACLQPTAGEVLWRDRPVHGPAEGVAMVFQSFALFPWLTVQENVELGLEARGVPRDGAREARRGGDRPDRPGRVRERLSEGAVRRHAPARRPGARAGGASRPAADGRAVQRARRADRGERCAPT